MEIKERSKGEQLKPSLIVQVVDISVKASQNLHIRSNAVWDKCRSNATVIMALHLYIHTRSSNSLVPRFTLPTARPLSLRHCKVERRETPSRVKYKREGEPK